MQPIFSAIEQIAPHWASWSFSCSNTNRTARSLISEAYLFPLLMAPGFEAEGENAMVRGPLDLGKAHSVGELADPGRFEWRLTAGFCSRHCVSPD